jgi:hypothetical protein
MLIRDPFELYDSYSVVDQTLLTHPDINEISRFRAPERWGKIGKDDPRDSSASLQFH